MSSVSYSFLRFSLEFILSAENDRVGVLRTSGGVLHFFVNGIDQGPAASNIPSKVYAVIDMYGKCAQVTVMDDNNRDMGKCSVRLAGLGKICPMHVQCKNKRNMNEKFVKLT